MKTRFPLYAKILAWFFLNLLVLAVAVLAVLSLQFRVGPELLVSGAAGERVQAVTGIIRDEINSRPRSEWNEILRRFCSNYRVQFLLFRNDGGKLAGDAVALPPELIQRIVDTRGAGPRRGRPPLRDDGPPRDDPDFRPPPGRMPEMLDRPPPGGANPIRFVMRTKNPTRYWIATGMPVIEGPNGPFPAMLILTSESLGAGGLLMDFTVWIWIGAGAIVFSILFWLPLVSSITRSVSQMQSATVEIAEGKFDVRVNENRRDELGSLGGAINRMAARLAGFVTGQKRFTGDIAHELCSPIARMQMALGILEERASQKEKPYLEDVREEVQHMSGLVNELLSFSKASLGAANIKLQSVALRPIVEKALHRETREGADIRVEISEEAQAIGDPELIIRAISNLLRNAIHYAGDAGPITVAATENGDETEILISDNGPGVPESELPKILDPFYRVDTSRTRETGGVGLGLSIVKTCVEACHGSVLCRNRQPQGFEVVLRLPR